MLPRFTFKKPKKKQFSIFFMAWGKMGGQVEQHSKIPKSLCKMGKTWHYSLRPTLKKS